MKEKDNIQDELKKLAPFLAEVKKDQPFKVPMDYFKEFPDEVLGKAGAPSKPSEQNRLADYLSRSLDQLARQIFRPAIGFSLAAVVLLITAGLWLWNNNPETTSSNSEDAIFASISHEEAYQYAIEHLDEIAPELIIETYKEELKESDYLDIPIMEENFEEEFLEEYLDDIDIEQLEEWL